MPICSPQILRRPSLPPLFSALLRKVVSPHPNPCPPTDRPPPLSAQRKGKNPSFFGSKARLIGRRKLRFSAIWWLSENRLNPIVANGFADHEIPMKNGYFIGNIYPTFSDIPIWWSSHRLTYWNWLKIMPKKETKRNNSFSIAGGFANWKMTENVESADLSAVQVDGQWIDQWIGLRENLQETMVFSIKYRAFL